MALFSPLLNCSRALVIGRACIYLLVTLATALAFSDQTFDDAIFEARFIDAVSDTIPAEHENWQQVSLPHIWHSQARPSEAIHRGWYRLDLPVSLAQTQHPAVLIPRVTMNLRVYLNETLIYLPGRTSEPLSRNWNRAHLISLDGLLSADQSNRLYIEVYTYPNLGALSPVLIGDLSQLEPVFSFRNWAQNSLNQILFSISLMVGTYAFLLWLTRRSEPVYLYFAAASSDLDSSPSGAFCWNNSE